MNILAGRHLMIDAWAMDEHGSVPAAVQERLNDRRHLEAVLNDLVGLAGMKILKAAEVLTVPLQPELLDTDKDCGGSTGVVILTTSHASVHTWPLRGQVCIDLFSCRDFPDEALLAFLAEALSLSGGTVRSVTRRHDPAHRDGFTWVS